MAYSAPTTRSTGNLITASIWNTDLVNNILFLANPPACRVYNTANISVPNNTDTYLTFNTEKFDTDTMHDTVTNTSRITCKTAGLYIVTGAVEWAANATGRRDIELMVNRTGFYNPQSSVVNSATIVLHQSVSDIIKLAVNDYIELKAYQDSGGALNIQAFGNTPSLSAVWIGLG